MLAGTAVERLTSGVESENEVEDAVGNKLCLLSWDSLQVEGLELSLALVELTPVSLHPQHSQHSHQSHATLTFSSAILA